MYSEMDHKKWPLQFGYYTPTGDKTVALMRYNEWIEIFPNEAIQAHVSHEKVLFSYGMKKCKGVTIYRTIKQALKARKNIRTRPTE